jgi:N-methylhydantoinase A
MLAPFDLDRLNEIYERLESSVRADLESKGVTDDRIVLNRQVEMRYRGQVHEIRVPLESKKLDEADLDSLRKEFERRYNLRYGRGAAHGEAGIEARTYLVRGVGRLEKPERRPQPLGGQDSSGAVVGVRDVYFKGRGFAQTSIVRRERLEPGNVVSGPAVIEAIDTTVLVHPDQLVRVDGWTNLMIEQVST